MSRATGSYTDAAEANTAGTTVAIPEAAVVTILSTRASATICKSEDPCCYARAIIEKNVAATPAASNAAESGATRPSPIAAAKATYASGASGTSTPAAAYNHPEGRARTKTEQIPRGRTNATAPSAGCSVGSVICAATTTLSPGREVHSLGQRVNEITCTSATTSTPSDLAGQAPAPTSSTRSPRFDINLAYPGRDCECLLRTRESEY